MARLPKPGGDDNKWGNVLNDFLSQSHDSDGRLKSEAVSSVVNATNLSFVPQGDITATNIENAIVEVEASAANALAAVVADKNLHGAERTWIPAVRRFRAEAARARAGGASTFTVWLGDSLTEAYTPSKRGFIWPLHLSRRLNGARQTRVEYIPSSASTFCSLNPADWPGGQMPWTYGPGAAGTIAYGPDMHGVNIPAGGFVELPYFGDVVHVRYTRTPAAPAGGCPVTVDGVAVGNLNANGPTLPGQAAAFGTIGDYGAHTIRISVPSGTLSFEGVTVFDGTSWGFGLNFGGIGVVVAGHAGFATTHFTDASAVNWAPSVASFAPCLVGIALGANDIGAGLPADQYRDGLIEIMNRIDAAVDATGGTRPGYLLVEMVGLPADYITAAWAACDAVDSNRCAVFNLATRLNTTDWGVLDNGGHPGDSGQIWIADAIADAIDDSSFRPPTTPAEGIIIEVSTPATTRSAWPENITVTPGTVPASYDASPGGAAVGSRRHRVWLDPGVYQARAALSRGTDQGQCQVLVGHTSLGTVDCYQASADVNIFTLGSNVTIDTPGWYPVTIRKLATKNAASSDYVIRFHRLHLRKV